MSCNSIWKNTFHALNSRLSLKCIFIIIIFFCCVEIFKLKSNFVPGNIRFSREPNGKSEETVLVLLSDIMEAPVTLNQDDPLLINKIRKQYLIPPSAKPYNLEGNTDDPSVGQTEEIRKLLKEKRNGFFVECGALDGETISNSLVFEKRYGWDGVLIEGSQKNFKLVLQKNRKAWTVPACLSILPHPTKVVFEQRFHLSKIFNLEQRKRNRKQDLVKIQCLPIYSILLALNRTTVDYFSLDVEGHELEVLMTIPWDKVNITTLSVEYGHIKNGKERLKSYMESKGYITYKEITYKRSLANDYIFYHPLLLTENKIISSNE